MIGLLSDAHGHVEGFVTALGVLEHLGCERMFFLGDAVGYLPGGAVVDAIGAYGVEPIAGNHEAMLLAGEDATSDGARVDDEIFRFAETRDDLGPTGLARVATWPTRRVVETAVGPVLLVHDSPFDEPRRIYPDTDLTGLGDVPWAVVCMGHTHRRFRSRVGDTTWVNVGSCALSRDDGSLGSVAMLDTRTGDVRLVRFDLREAHRRALDRVGPVHRSVLATMARRETPDRPEGDAATGDRVGRERPSAGRDRLTVGGTMTFDAPAARVAGRNGWEP